MIDLYEPKNAVFGSNRNWRRYCKKQLNKASQAQTATSATALSNRIKKDSSAHKVLLTDKKADKLLYFKQEGHLLACLQNLLKEEYPDDCCVHIEIVHKYRIILYPEKKVALVNLTDNQFRSVSYMKFENFNNNKMFQITLEKDIHLQEHISYNENKGFSLMTIDALFWRLAIQTSRGCLPEGVSINKKMRLHAWPNFTRLDKIPHAMRIAALWIDRNYTLREIGVVLNINQDDVNSFYVAADVLGLIDKVQSDVDIESDTTESVKSVVKNQKRGLFDAILRRLTGH